MNLRRAVALVLLAAACRRGPGARPGDRVLVRYELSSGGAVVESNFDGPPVAVAQGAGELPADVDSALIGMSPGDEKTVALASGTAFGPYDPARVETTPLSELGELGRGLKAGQKILGFRDGKPETASVVRVADGKAVLDFNPPLAGKPAVYRLRIVAVDSPP